MTLIIILACLFAALVIFATGVYIGDVGRAPGRGRRPREIRHVIDWCDWSGFPNRGVEWGMNKTTTRGETDDHH